jgi:hypothetical protein
MRIDESRAYDKILCIDLLLGAALRKPAHSRNPTVPDPNIGSVRRVPSSVGDFSVLDDDIERHDSSTSLFGPASVPQAPPFGAGSKGTIQAQYKRKLPSREAPPFRAGSFIVNDFGINLILKKVRCKAD